ncbi:lipopolysaccharide assembly protein LapA domain-containing protein [Acidiphilium sp.]|uniref:lipopolysaccharide assembly protein LapA domain-containing protein n=1 Tax=Acidiphilium sp. TaxID=527 RepID=UPI003D017969
MLVVFLLSNRADAVVGFWPFGTLGAAPLGAIVLVAFALGVLIGMVLLVPHRIRAHRRARTAEKQVAALRAAQATAPSASDPAPLMLPPAR